MMLQPALFPLANERRTQQFQKVAAKRMHP